MKLKSHFASNEFDDGKLSSQDVVSKVVWYLREKADAEDLKLSAANLLGPVLAVLYNCTPGQPPKFAP